MSDNSDCNCDQALRLQAEVETTEQLKILYKNKLFEAEARIDELEANQGQLDRFIRKEITKPQNEVKAEGIKEMLLYCMVTKPEVDEYGVPIRIIDIDDIEEYADKLEGKDGI